MTVYIAGNQNVTWDPVSDKGAKKVQVQLPEDSSTAPNSTHNIVHSKQLGMKTALAITWSQLHHLGFKLN